MCRNPNSLLQVERQAAEADKLRTDAAELRQYRKSLAFKVRAHAAVPSWHEMSVLIIADCGKHILARFYSQPTL